uniref:C-type lectin domain-containing protein n=1 Tax=Oryzias latipes TaxID=8090 RepID=A0A3B3HZM0_ORYLA
MRACVRGWVNVCFLCPIKGSVQHHSTYELETLHICQTCPKDWIQFQESCYFFYNLNSPWKTWNESRQFCQTLNVYISQLHLQTFIKNTIQHYHDTWHGYWIGLQKVNNKWIWLLVTKMFQCFQELSDSQPLLKAVIHKKMGTDFSLLAANTICKIKTNVLVSKLLKCF